MCFGNLLNWHELLRNDQHSHCAQRHVLVTNNTNGTGVLGLGA